MWRGFIKLAEKEEERYRKIDFEDEERMREATMDHPSHDGTGSATLTIEKVLLAVFELLYHLEQSQVGLSRADLLVGAKETVLFPNFVDCLVAARPVLEQSLPTYLSCKTTKPELNGRDFFFGTVVSSQQKF